MSHLYLALLVTIAFALLGWAVGGVTLGGALAGLVVAFLLYYGIAPGAFGVLFAVFVLTWVTTRLGHGRKRRLGVAERRRGRRTAGQVLANLGVSGAFAALVLFKMRAPHLSPVLGDVGMWTVASIAALAEAAADTCSSECGEACSDTAFLVPSFRSVRAGTDGAITLVGTLAGIAAAVVVAALAAVLHLLPQCAGAAVATAGVLGMFVDTVLGAMLERRHLLNNNAVNFCSTLAAALCAIALTALCA